MPLTRLNQTVVVNMSTRSEQRGLWHWAVSNGIGVRIDRRTMWGNPFKIGIDGANRNEVLLSYHEYLLHQRSDLMEHVPDLYGKVLGCWCAPERCHGDLLAALSMLMRREQ